MSLAPLFTYSRERAGHFLVCLCFPFIGMVKKTIEITLFRQILNPAGPSNQNVKTMSKSEIPGCPFSLNSGALIPANSINAFLCGQIFE